MSPTQFQNMVSPDKYDREKIEIASDIFILVFLLLSTYFETKYLRRWVENELGLIEFMLMLSIIHFKFAPEPPRSE